MKIGISIKIDVTKIDKARLHQGAKGTYLDLTTFIDTEQVGQYGDHGFISQSQTKEERESGADKMPILGNCKVFYKKEADPNNISEQLQRPVDPPPAFPGGDDEMSTVPF